MENKKVVKLESKVKPEELENGITEEMKENLTEEEISKEFENELERTDNEINNELTLLQQQENYIRHKTVDELNNFIDEYSKEVRSDIIIDILIKAGLTTKEEIKEQTTSLFILKVEELKKNVEKTRVEVEKRKQEYDEKLSKDMSEDERKQMETMLTIQELSTRIYNEEVDRVIETLKATREK